MDGTTHRWRPWLGAAALLGLMVGGWFAVRPVPRPPLDQRIAAEVPSSHRATEADAEASERHAWEVLTVERHEERQRLCGADATPMRCVDGSCVTIYSNDPGVWAWDQRTRFLRRPTLVIDELLEARFDVPSPCLEAHQRWFTEIDDRLAALDGPDHFCAVQWRDVPEPDAPVSARARELCAELGGSAAWPQRGP